MNYFQTDEKDISIDNTKDVTSMYDQGFVLTRKNKGNFIQTRSLRIKLAEFNTSSENRRILNKNLDLVTKLQSLPLANYDWHIHALGKEFYTKRFGDGTMSASKIKEMFTEVDNSNMNSVFVYNYQSTQQDSAVGYTLSYQNEEIIHYAYPFYSLEQPKEKNLGMAMMLNAIIFAKENNKSYIYLGSVVERKSLYKLQFSGLEWFNTDTKQWESDVVKLKEIIEATATD